MDAVLAFRQGQGGWPLNVFLTPKREFFFGGTYWPPQSRVGMPGFDQVLHSVLDAFANRREQVDEQSSQITSWLNQSDSADGPPNDFEIDRSILNNALLSMHRNFDFEDGGFGAAPKFPHAIDLSLLIRLVDDGANNAVPVDLEIVRDMIRISLKKMAYGGIFDHLAGGFARYSVDEKWLVPHFEKMLYDNALLASTYTQMYASTGARFYRMIAEKTLGYLRKYMTAETGAFFSAEDADSEGVEGKFYVWSRDEVLEVLGDETGIRFTELYNVTEYGNFEGRNILNMTESYQQFADRMEIDKEALRDEMRLARKKLLEFRDRRVRPGLDDKVLVSWNGLAISAFATTAKQFGDKTLLNAAKQAASFIWENCRGDDGRLLHTWKAGHARLNGYLDDYANMIDAFISLYQVDWEPKWIDRAAVLAEMMIQHFWDNDDGGFFFTSDDHEKLITRPKVYQDSSVPSGNGMAAFVLLRLGRLAGNIEWIERAEQTIRSSASLIRRAPLAAGQMLIAIHEFLSTSQQFVIIAPDEYGPEILMKNIAEHNRTTRDLIVHTAAAKPPVALENMLAGKTAIGNEWTLYVCEGFSCSAPIIGFDSILDRIRT